jgi:hypothetical protein
LFAGAGAPRINIFVEPLRENVPVGRLISAPEFPVPSSRRSERRKAVSLGLSAAQFVSSTNGRRPRRLPVYSQRIVCPPKLTTRIVFDLDHGDLLRCRRLTVVFVCL